MAETLAAINILRRAQSVNSNKETLGLYRSILSYLDNNCKNRSNQYFERNSNSNDIEINNEEKTSSPTSKRQSSKNSSESNNANNESNSRNARSSSKNNSSENTKNNSDNTKNSKNSTRSDIGSVNSDIKSVNSDIGSTGSNSSNRTINANNVGKNSKSPQSEKGKEDLAYLQTLVEMPTVAALDSGKTTKIFNKIPEEDINYICKAIHDVKEDYDYTDIKDTLIDQFIIASSSFYQGETVGQLINGLLAVQANLLEQCSLFGLVGPMADIHTTLFAFDLLKFDSVALYGYCRLFFIQLGEEYYQPEVTNEMEFDEQDHLNLVIAALYGKFAFLERVRINAHVYDVLFTDPDTRQVTFNGSLMFYDCETSDIIIGRGPDYYYPRCGNVTMADIRDRFSPQDTLFSLAQFQKGRYVASNNNIHDDLAALLIKTVYERKTDDPRTFITPIGPKHMINTPEWNTLLSLNEDIAHKYSDVFDER